MTVSGRKSLLVFVGVTKSNNTHFSGLDYPESIAIYEECSQRIETYSETIYFVLVKVTPISFVAPVCFGCLFMYFANNSDNEALKLPIPMWYVFYSLHFYQKLKFIKVNLKIPKVSVQLNQSYWIFDCCCFGICIECTLLLLQLGPSAIGDWHRFIYTLYDRRHQEQFE